MKQITIIIFFLLATSLSCTKKSANSPTTAGNPSSGTMTTSDSKTSNASTGTRDLSGTWIANEGPRVWELVISKVDDNTWNASPTLISNSEKDGLIDYGPPGSKGTPGRDHWGNAMFCLLGGGGLKGGQIVGSTDRLGTAPDSRPLTPSNLHATIYHVLGIDPHLQLLDTSGRPVNVLDDPTPISELL